MAETSRRPREGKGKMSGPRACCWNAGSLRFAGCQVRHRTRSSKPSASFRRAPVAPPSSAAASGVLPPPSDSRRAATRRRFWRCVTGPAAGPMSMSRTASSSTRVRRSSRSRFSSTSFSRWPGKKHPTTFKSSPVIPTTGSYFMMAGSSITQATNRKSSKRSGNSTRMTSRATGVFSRRQKNFSTAASPIWPTGPSAPFGTW